MQRSRLKLIQVNFYLEKGCSRPSPCKSSGPIENNQLKLAAIGPIDHLIVCDEGVTPKKYHGVICHPVGKKQSI